MHVILLWGKQEEKKKNQTPYFYNSQIGRVAKVFRKWKQKIQLKNVPLKKKKKNN